VTDLKPKSVNAFTREMINVFGIDHLAIRLTDQYGNLIKKTENWDKQEKLILIESQKKKQMNNKKNFTRNEYANGRYR
jgi:hypothetical protein